MRAVGAGHVLGNGRRLSVVAAPVRRDALVAVEDLDRVGRVADLDLLADQLVRHAVDVVLDRHVIVDVDAASLPLREDVTRGRQGPQRLAVELLVEDAAADAQLLHRPVVELVEQDADRGVERTELEEGLVAQTGEYPPLCNEHTILDRSLVARFPRPRRDDDRAVVGGQVFVGAVDAGLVAAGAGDGAFQLVGDPHRSGATEVLRHADVRVDPVGQLLGLGRLGVGEAAGAEHRDEQLDRPQLTRTPVDQARPLAREIDEGLLAGAVDLSHRRPQPLDPSSVELAELGVAVAARMDLKVLLPEQLQRDAVALQFPVDVCAVRPDPVAHQHRAGEQLSIERRIVQFGRQRPAEPLLRRPLQIQRDRAHADGAGLGYRPVGQPPLVLEPKNLTNLPHRQPPCRHRLAPPVERAKACWIRLPTSVHDDRNRCSTSRNRCSTSPETGVQLPPKPVFNFLRKTHPSRSRLLLVREGGQADSIRQSDTGRACCDQLDSRRGKPAGAASSDRHEADLRSVER